MKVYIIIGAVILSIGAVFYFGFLKGSSDCQKASTESIKTISEIKTVYIKNTANITATDKRKKLMEWVK